MSQSWAVDVKNSKFYGSSKKNGVAANDLCEGKSSLGETSKLIMADETSAIGAFYKDKSVFITGATGFVGKVLLEKLLRSCSGVKTIYVLLRAKEGHDCRQRLDHIFSVQMFDPIKKDNASILTKVVPINGDITLPSLGISQSDLALLTNNVAVVFHCAATVRFDEPFKTSVDINVLGTRRVLEICHKMTQLAALIHVSTAYSYCNRDEIDEIVYTEPVSPQKIIDAADWMSEELLDTVVPHLMNGRPSNYHYTKAVAENLVVQEGGNLPMAIVRPSIISGAYREPLPGWVDNFNGPQGFIVATGKGVLRTMIVKSNIAADMVPVDAVSNMLVATGWYIGTRRPNETIIFNCTSGPFNRLTWGDIHRISYPVLLRYPSMEMFRYPGGSYKTSRIYNKFCIAVNHYLPAYIVDMLARATGQKPGMVALYHRIHRALGFLEYFTTREWTFHANNVIMLCAELEGRDKETFNFDFRDIGWHEYVGNYVKGVRKYLLKEDDSTLPAARTKLRRIYIVSQLARFIFIIGSMRLLYNNSRFVRRWWWRFVFAILQMLQGPLSKILA